MGYVGFDELNLFVKGMPGVMHFAKTSNESAGVGYSTRARENRDHHFHVKWHPVEGGNVVDRFHVKNENMGRSIYYGISFQRLIYYKAGPNGNVVDASFYNYDKYLLEDCGDIASLFLKKLSGAGYTVYEKETDAESAYKARQKAAANEHEQRDKKNNLAVAYSVLWAKLSPSDQKANPKVGPVEIRQKSFQEVEAIYNKIEALAPKGSVPDQSPASKMVVGTPLPKGFVAQPGGTAHIGLASALPGGVPVRT